MTEVQWAEPTRRELEHERRAIREHLAQCCGAKDGTRERLERLGVIDYLLGGTQ